MQKAIQNGIIMLTADNGMKLTNGSSFGSVVCLGVNDSESNWAEVTEAEAERMMAEAEKEEITDTEALEILLGGSA